MEKVLLLLSGPNSIIFACEMRDEQFEMQRGELFVPIPLANVVFATRDGKKSNSKAFSGFTLTRG
jgi:hypothetical protein